MHTIGAVCVVSAVDALEVDERPAAVGAALHARLHAGLAADAAALVDHEDRRVVDSVLTTALVEVEVASVVSARPPALTTTAATLNSGIFDVGSSARLVSWLAAWRRASGTG